MGKRWSFRDLLTLVPELIVGEWEDFGGYHPCKWVREQVANLSIDEAAVQARPCLQLLSHLYPHALFPEDWMSDRALDICRDIQTSTTDGVAGLFRALTECRGVRQSTYMRSLLQQQVAPLLDPYLESPHRDSDIMSQLEDAYSQSIALGQQCWRGLEHAETSEALPSGVEKIWSSLLEVTESQLSVAPEVAESTSRGARCLLRQQACMTAKRSVGTRTGDCALKKEFAEYVQTIREPDHLAGVQDLLLKQMGKDDFEFDVLETLGQPHLSHTTQVLLISDALGCRVNPAPLTSDARPGHDLPSLEVDGTSIPLTFELYGTLRRLLLGCEAGTLPLSVRGLLDRARQVGAGKICRDEDLFQNAKAKYKIGSAGYGIGVREQGEPYARRPFGRGGR